MKKLEEGCSLRQTAKMFGIHFTTITNWKRRETLAPKTPIRKQRKIDLDALRKDIKTRPDDYLHERAKRFNCTAEGIRKALKKLNITYKKHFSTQKLVRKFEKSF